MKIRMTVLALLAVTVGVFAYTRTHNPIPSDLRDAVADNAIGALKAERGGQDVKVPEPEIKPFYVETGSRRGLSNKGYMEPVEPAPPIAWVPIPGGKFPMGTNSFEHGFGNAKPVHEVSIESFEMAETAVTVAQYGECVIKGVCTEPGTGDYCNWGKSDRKRHPVNCVDWYQARTYAKFKNARLPSEAEFEYAATSGGRNQKYPWGNEEPTSELSVFNTDSTMPVCSKPKGNTAQGLCDMSGNVWQWVQDNYQDSYKGAPTDGNAFIAVMAEDFYRVVRGGSFDLYDARYLRADYRGHGVPGRSDGSLGFRLAR